MENDWIFLPNLEYFCPLFIQIAQMSLILPRWGLTFPEYHHQPLLFIQLSQTPFGDLYVLKTPPKPPQNTQFLGPLHGFRQKPKTMKTSR